MSIAWIALLGLLSTPAQALEFGPGFAKQIEDAMVRLRAGLSKLNASTVPCAEGTDGAAPSSRWLELPPELAQCTPGAKSEGHHARVRITAFPKDAKLDIELLKKATEGAVKLAIQQRTLARYVGNGPIFMDDGRPNGLVVAGGRTRAALDCYAFRTNTGNLGRNNSVFVRYRPRKEPYGKAGYANEWRYRVIPTTRLCAQFQPQDYLYWLRREGVSGEALANILRSGKRTEADNEDLVEPGQIDFAIQSGPGVLIESNNLLAGYNRATGYRSYLGVSQSGDPVILEADGNIGSYCVGEFAKSQGIRDLLHRDSFVSDAVYRESDGTVTGYPSQNPSATAASLLVISPSRAPRAPRLPW